MSHLPKGIHGSFKFSQTQSNNTFRLNLCIAQLHICIPINNGEIEVGSTYLLKVFFIASTDYETFPDIVLLPLLSIRNSFHSID